MGKEKRIAKAAANESDPVAISRRDFIKFGVGAAALTISAAGVIGKLPLSMEQPQTAPVVPRNGSEPIVATVEGDQVTVMKGQDSVKAKDPVLAALIAGRLGAGN
ncbi:MAG TPA: twin-arginine translocation signal domain-containing protein [Candidatus Binatus sp.]|nr:twin-arginine translocation signal domain-containing protein [Candidatus Binatus sp.]